jgi:hypothetical protein
MKIALGILLIALSAKAASLTGAIVDAAGGYIANGTVELVSATKNFWVQTDDSGVYRFPDLPAGKYTLTFRPGGFEWLTFKSIVLSEHEEKVIPDVALNIPVCGLSFDRDLVLLPTGVLLGRLSGSVTPRVPGVEVTLVCRTFAACRSTKTDSNGKFSFDMLSAGLYGLNIHREGYYPVSATGYQYIVSAGLESIYNSIGLERCPKGNCDPKLRPQRSVYLCE